MKFKWSDAIKTAEREANALSDALAEKHAAIRDMKSDQVISELKAKGVSIGDKVDVVRRDKMWGRDEVKEYRETGIFVSVVVGATFAEPLICKIKANGTASSRKLYLSYGCEIVPVGAPFPEDEA